MKKMCGFIKEHKFCSLVMAPLVLFLAFLVLGLSLIHILSEVLLTIREGKFHQVKRMFEALGCHVEFLKRMSMGPLRLDPELKPGEYRPLTEEEIRSLKECRNG